MSNLVQKTHTKPAQHILYILTYVMRFTLTSLLPWPRMWITLFTLTPAHTPTHACICTQELLKRSERTITLVGQADRSHGPAGNRRDEECTRWNRDCAGRVATDNAL